MDTEYVVEVEVTGFAVEGMVDVDGSRVTKRKAEKVNDEKRAAVDALEVDLVEVLQRDDGTGIFYFHWDPPVEGDDDGPAEDGAQTWMAAKGYTEHVISAVVGAGFSIVEHRVVTRDRAAPPPADENASPPSSASDDAPSPSPHEGTSGGDADGG